MKNISQYFGYDFTVQVTPQCEDLNIPVLGASKVKNGIFRVFSSCPCEFFWQVFAKRGDIVTEPIKNEVKLNGFGPYKFIS